MKIIIIKESLETGKKVRKKIMTNSFAPNKKKIGMHGGMVVLVCATVGGILFFGRIMHRLFFFFFWGYAFALHNIEH